MTSTVRFLLLCALATPSLAWAQDAGTFEPRPVNPASADAPADVIRELSLPEPDAGAADAGLDDVDGGLDSLVDAGPGPTVATPAQAQKDEPWTVTAALSISARLSYQGASAFPLDPGLQPTTIAPLMTRVRVSPEVHLGPFALVAEVDAATGAVFGSPDVTADLPPDLETRQQLRDRVPFPRFVGLEAYGARQLYVEYKWSTGVFRVGQQTAHWGLGLLANDGAKDPAPGDFGQVQFGNLTYRALLSARPLERLGGLWRLVETSVAADLIVRDNLADFSWGDRAFQAVLALRLARDEAHSVGVYGVYRNQRNQFVAEGKALDAFIVDVAGRWQFFDCDERALKVGFEVVGVAGTAKQAGTLRQVGQLGMAVKAAWRLQKTSLSLDAGLASGDQDPSDGRLSSFRFDRDYKVGLVLFDHVLAYQTARAAARASHPDLGTPPEGTELLGTGGSITGAWYLFPRVNYALADWVDLYGGPLFAFSTAKLTDGYDPSQNSLGGSPGRYLGTELDLGLQARFHPVPELLLTATAEAGLFLPGDAFRLADASLLSPVGFGRVRAGLSF